MNRTDAFKMIASAMALADATDATDATDGPVADNNLALFAIDRAHLALRYAMLAAPADVDELTKDAALHLAVFTIRFIERRFD